MKQVTQRIQKRIVQELDILPILKILIEGRYQGRTIYKCQPAVYTCHQSAKQQAWMMIANAFTGKEITQSIENGFLMLAINDLEKSNNFAANRPWNNPQCNRTIGQETATWTIRFLHSCLMPRNRASTALAYQQMRDVSIFKRLRRLLLHIIKYKDKSVYASARDVPFEICNSLVSYHLIPDASLRKEMTTWMRVNMPDLKDIMLKVAKSLSGQERDQIDGLVRQHFKRERTKQSNSTSSKDTSSKTKKSNKKDTKRNSSNPSCDLKDNKVTNSSYGSGSSKTKSCIIVTKKDSRASNGQKNFTHEQDSSAQMIKANK